MKRVADEISGYAYGTAVVVPGSTWISRKRPENGRYIQGNNVATSCGAIAGTH
jgi:hypothetical protein